MKKILKQLMFGLIILCLFNNINAMDESINANAIETDRKIGNFEVLPDEILHEIILYALQGNINQLNIFNFSQRFLKDRLDRIRLISKYFAHLIRKSEFAALVQNKLSCLRANLKQDILNQKKAYSLKPKKIPKKNLADRFVQLFKSYLPNPIPYPEEDPNDPTYKLEELLLSYSETPELKKYDKLVEFVRLVIAGADVDASNLSGNTALEFALEDGYIGIAMLLKELGADITVTDFFGRSPLMIAVICRNLTIIRLLKSMGADVNHQDGCGHNALIIAACIGRPDILRLIVEMGPKIDVQNRLGMTGLMMATRKDKIEAVKFLISLDANIELQNNDGETALIIAVKKGNIEIVELLLNHGANINVIDKCNMTPLEWAEREGHTKVVELLKTSMNQ